MNDLTTRFQRCILQLQSFLHVFTACAVLFSCTVTGAFLLFSAGGVASEDLFDNFGGYRKIQTDPTGFFAAEKIGPRWFLFTPEGNAFYSIGVGRVSSILPHQIGMLEGEYDNSVFKWGRETISRLKRCGINTLGNRCNIGFEQLDDMWSDTRLYIRSKMPFVYEIHFNVDYDMLNLLPPSKRLDEFLPDVFSEDFREKCILRAEIACTKLVGNQYLIGYFLGNELHWEYEFLNYLPHRQWKYRLWISKIIQQECDTPGKAAFVDLMRDLYNDDFESFRGTYQSFVEKYDIFSFADLAHIKRFAKLTDDDAREFMRLIARNFFEKTTHAIRMFDRNHMILGTRFACDPGIMNDVVIEEASQYCDVLSLNIYSTEPSRQIRVLHDAVDTPILVTEFGFHSEDCGYPIPPEYVPKIFSLPVVDSQSERGQVFNDYMRIAAKIPSVVGCHWYALYDSPYDENGDPFWDDESKMGTVNFGFIDTKTNDLYSTFADSTQFLAANIWKSILDDEIPPARIVDLIAFGSDHSGCELYWTAPGDDGMVGRAFKYYLRFATFHITPENWEEATPVEDMPEPQEAGSIESIVMADLSPGQVYYFGIITEDLANNFSSLSNVALYRTE
jgi:hypothetical protein